MRRRKPVECPERAYSRLFVLLGIEKTASIADIGVRHASLLIFEAAVSVAPAYRSREQEAESKRLDEEFRSYLAPSHRGPVAVRRLFEEVYRVLRIEQIVPRDAWEATFAIATWLRIRKNREQKPGEMQPRHRVFENRDRFQIIRTHATLFGDGLYEVHDWVAGRCLHEQPYTTLQAAQAALDHVCPPTRAEKAQRALVDAVRTPRPFVLPYDDTEDEDEDDEGVSTDA